MWATEYDVKKHTHEIGLKKRDASDRTEWRDNVHELSTNMKLIRPPGLTKTKPESEK